MRTSSTSAGTLASTPIRRRPAFFRADGVLRTIRANLIGSIGFAIVLALIAVAIFADVIAPFSPEAVVSPPLHAPDSRNLLGTDQFGRDQLSRIIYGSRISLYVGVLATSIGLLGGLILGLLGGYRGGWIDNIIQRLVEIKFAFPGLVLQIGIAGLLGPSLTNAMLAIGFSNIGGMSRIVRGPTLSVKNQDYVVAAQVIGATDLTIATRHVLPNIAAPIIVHATFSVSGAILAESALSFLGLGTQPPTPSWGQMLSNGRNFMEIAPWVAVFPGAAIFLVVLGLNLAGDGLRDILDPELRRSGS